MTATKEGGPVPAHVCSRCREPFRFKWSKSNPATTDFCVVCNHRFNGNKMLVQNFGPLTGIRPIGEIE